MKNMLILVTLLVACGVVRAGSVWDDCAAWYVGADDKNGNGYYDSGELFDVRQGGDASSVTHGGTLGMTNRQNVQILTEDVECATLGRTLANQKVLYFDGSLSTTNNGSPVVNGNYINFPDVITGEVYTALVRFKVDEHHPWDSSYQYLIDFGCDYNNYTGAEIAFPNTPGDNFVRLTYGKNAVADAFNKKICLTNSIYAARSATWQEMAFVASRPSETKISYRMGLFQPAHAKSENNVAAKVQWADKTVTVSATSVTSNKPIKGALRLGAEGGDKTMYRGRVHMVAFWNRALSDDEIREALGTPNPGLFKVGLSGQDGSKLFGGPIDRNVTVSSLPEHWREMPAKLVKGKSVNIGFDVQAWQTNLNQILRFTPSAGSGSISVKVDDAVISTDVPVTAGKTACVSVRGRHLDASGVHTCTITRVDSGAGDLVVGGIDLSGSWQIAENNWSFSDMNTGGASMPDFYLTDGDWMHMRRVILPTSHTLTLHFDMPSEFAGQGAKLIWGTIGKSGQNNKAKLTLNGKVVDDFPSEIQDKVVREHAFPAGSFKAGENTFLWENAGTESGKYYGFDFIRFQLDPIPTGMVILIR